MVPIVSPKVSAWLLYLKGMIALPTADNNNEVAWAQWLRFYPHTGNGRFIGLVRISRPGW